MRKPDHRGEYRFFWFERCNVCNPKVLTELLHVHTTCLTLTTPKHLVNTDKLDLGISPKKYSTSSLIQAASNFCIPEVDAHTHARMHVHTHTKLERREMALISPSRSVLLLQKMWCDAWECVWNVWCRWVQVRLWAWTSPWWCRTSWSEPARSRWRSAACRRASPSGTPTTTTCSASRRSSKPPTKSASTSRASYSEWASDQSNISNGFSALLHFSSQG